MAARSTALAARLSLAARVCQRQRMNLTATLGAVLSVIAGLLGLLWPRAVSRVVGLALPGPLGVSEVRATYGGLFVAAGAAVLVLQQRASALVLGAGWAGACAARLVSLVVDRSRSRENLAGVVVEGAMAALLLAA